MKTALNGETQISVDQFYKMVQRQNDLFLLDVRNDEEYDSWKIESLHPPDSVHMFYGEFLEDEEEFVSHVPRDREIVVLCAKGGASDFVAEELREKYGIKAVNLTEGMIGWGNYYVTRPVVRAQRYEIYQIDRVARGCLSYIIISEGEAAIIDPLRHIDQYLQILDQKNAALKLILDTHAHADHISGGFSLSQETGAPYYLHPYDGIHPFDLLPAKFHFEMLHHGKEFVLGDLRIEVIHVPGHTLGQVNFLLESSDPDPYFFTGDNLFIQSFGRPDLGGKGEKWAPIVYESIFRTVKENVPPEALVLPGHYAKPSEVNHEGIFAKRLADLWKENSDLKLTNQDMFIQFVLDHLPEMPEQYIEIKRVNAGLSNPDEAEASELELGKNVCALSTAY